MKYIGQALTILVQAFQNVYANCIKKDVIQHMARQHL